MNVVARTAALLRPRTSNIQIGPIGVDIALEAIHFVQLETTEDGNPTVRARASLKLDCSRDDFLKKPEQFRSMIKRALASGRFQGNKAVLTLPAGMFRTVSINYRLSSTETSEAEAIVRVMKERLDGDLNSYVLDYMPVRGRSQKDERLAMVAVSERETVVEFLEFARKSGLDVTALEIGPLAISRLVGTITADNEDSNVLVVNSGRRASYMTLISGSDLLFDQEVAVGEQSLIKQISETLDMPENIARNLVSRSGIEVQRRHDAVSDAIDESGVLSTLSEILKPQFLILAEEIKRAFLYAASETRGRNVTQVYLLGSIARWPGSDKLLSTLTGSKVEKIPDLLSLFPNDNTAAIPSTTAPEIAVATGLALRGMTFDG